MAFWRELLVQKKKKKKKRCLGAMLLLQKGKRQSKQLTLPAASQQSTGLSSPLAHPLETCGFPLQRRGPWPWAGCCGAMGVLGDSRSEGRAGGRRRLARV